MPFDVYPQPQTAPLTVAPGPAGQSTPLLNERHSSGASPEMFIRVAIISSAVAPTLKLQAGTGDAVVAPAFPTTAAVFDQPSGTGNYVAAITMTAESNGVYLVNVFLSKLGSVWSFTIVNNDAVARGFTFVVADSDADSQQPWIDMETTIGFDALITETGNQTLQIFNHGTGPLSGITPAVSGAGAAGFTVTVPPGQPVNPNSLMQVPVTLNPAATPQSLAATLDISSNDTTAQKVAGHNSEVALSGSVGMLEVAFMLDTSGSMAMTPDGSQTNTPALTRWSSLVSAANMTLDHLGNFGTGKGNFAVGMYPDITAFPPDMNTPLPPGTQFPVPSPSAADILAAQTPITGPNITTAKNDIALHWPRFNGAATPMGAGIAQAIGPTNASYGYFTDSNFSLNRRWLVLMTDGNDNSDPPFPTDFFVDPPDPNNPPQGFVAKQIEVITLGYGNTQMSGATQPVNTTLLQNIAAGAYQGLVGGQVSEYMFAQTATPTMLASQFIKALAAGLTLDTMADPAGVLTASSPTVSRQVIVGPYDNKISFLVAWSTPTSDRLEVEVTTPLGEVIPPSPATGCTIDIGDRYRIITLDKSFLDNARAGKPRYGTWTLTITLPTIILEIRSAAVAEDSEPYSYQIVTDSRLNLRCTLDKGSYAAGDSITLTARLSLDGQSVTGAAVNVSQSTPGTGSLNWLAATPLSASDYAAVAAAQANNPDINSLGIKNLALQNNGTTFNPVTNSTSASLTDPGGTGTYTVTSSNTSVPGTYGFLVTAVGALPDGSLFRREQSVTIEVIVRADPAYTAVQVAYLPGTGGNLQATITVWPKDRFGNVILIDPKFDPSILFTTSSGSLTGAIVDNHDGSYSQGVTYPAATPPVIGVTVGGVPVVPGIPLEPVGDLHFVDKVYRFTVGAEAAPGANQHTNPDACLGDFTKKAAPGFVSLGAGGSIVVGFSGHYAVDDEHGNGITVFVEPDQTLRAYSVEAHHGDDDDGWFQIGQSPGVTQTFSLRRHGRLPTARAVRIRDQSGQIRNPDGTPSASPGVSVLAVGARRIERGDGDLDDLILQWLKKF